MLLAQLGSAQAWTARAELLAGRGRSRQAFQALRYAMRHLLAYEHRLDSLAGRQVVSAATRAQLEGLAGAIQADIATLLETL